MPRTGQVVVLVRAFQSKRRAVYFQVPARYRSSTRGQQSLAYHDGAARRLGGL